MTELITLAQVGETNDEPHATDGTASLDNNASTEVCAPTCEIKVTEVCASTEVIINIKHIDSNEKDSHPYLFSIFKAYTLVYIAVLLWNKIAAFNFSTGMTTDITFKNYILISHVGAMSSLEITSMLVVISRTIEGLNPSFAFSCYIMQFLSAIIVSNNYNDFTYIQHELDMFLISNWVFVFVQWTYAFLSLWISITVSYDKKITNW